MVWLQYEIQWRRSVCLKEKEEEERHTKEKKGLTMCSVGLTCFPLSQQTQTAAGLQCQAGLHRKAAGNQQDALHKLKSAYYQAAAA